MNTTAPLLPGAPPWDQATVDRLDRQQQAGNVHPFTCGNRAGADFTQTHTDGEGVLVATPGGWKCPYCGYTQA